MENKPKREDVTLRVNFISFLAGKNFRGNVSGGAASVVNIVFRLSIDCKSKVSYDWIESIFSSQHDVFRLDISMHDFVFVHFIESSGHSPHEGLDLFFREPCQSLVDSRMELPITEELKDDVDGVLALEDGFQFHDIGRLESSKHFYFV